MKKELHTIPDNIVPSLLDIRDYKDLEPDEYPVYNEWNDPDFYYNYKYVVDIDNKKITINNEFVIDMNQSEANIIKMIKRYMDEE